MQIPSWPQVQRVMATRRPTSDAAESSSATLDCPAVHDATSFYHDVLIEVRFGQARMVGNNLNLLAHLELALDRRRGSRPDEPMLLRDGGDAQRRMAFDRPERRLEREVLRSQVLGERQRAGIYDKM